MKRTIFLILSFLFLSTTFKSDSIKTYGWYQQSFPNLNGSSITSITFLDSLTGFAVTNSNSLLQEYILKTNNGGDNWSINYTYSTPNSNWSFFKIAFINSNTGFAFSWFEMFKTTNKGDSWTKIDYNISCEDFAVITEDTILAVSASGFEGGVYRSTNGGYNWQLIWTNGTSGNPSIIYMFDKNMGYIQDQNFNYDMRRTTNGGFNWISVTGEKFTSIKFLDNNTGWKVTDSVKKTTNSGISWLAQQTPRLNVDLGNYTDFSILNKDTIWMVGARSFVFKAPIYKTTNGGANWGYQIPDPNMQIFTFSYIQFVNSKTGWVLPTNLNINLLHTTSGGNDTTYFTGIKIVPGNLPERYLLGQNYPNPFNPATSIPFELKESSHVALEVYDANGRLVKELVNGNWGPGKYIADFDGSGFSSGVYFYRIAAHGTTNNFTQTKKMLLLK